MEQGEHREQYYIKLFRYLFNNQQKYVDSKKNDEEFYYADVEGTRTQFTKDQLNAIKAKYDIPISSKLTFAIVESFRAHITGMDPYPRLIAVEEQHKQWAQYWERVISSVWYEASVNDELDSCVKDMLTTGSGYLHVRTNNFYKETTFNVTAEYVPWSEVFIDPASKKSDLSDADFVCIARAKPIYKLEQEYSITIDDEEELSIVDPHVPAHDIPYNWPDFGFSGPTNDTEQRKKTKFAWEKLFYTSTTIQEYVADNGAIGVKSPRLVTIPNEEKMAAAAQLEQVGMAIEQMAQPTTGNPDVDIPQEDQLTQANEQYSMMLEEYRNMPDYVQKYHFIAENDQEFYVDSFILQKKKRFKQALQIDKKIMFEKTLPTDTLPLIHLTFSHFRNPHKTYGVVHYTKDLVKGINKLWGLMIYDMQLRTGMRILAPSTAILDPSKFESRFAVPGSVNLYEPDFSLTDGGKPEIMDAGTASAQLPQLISMLVQLAEYITGLFGLMQGNAEAAPPTFGATQSLQNFGSQRIKLTARGIERPLNQLIYNILVYAQRYAPLEKLMFAIDPENPDNAEEIIAQSSEARYKVRTILTNNLPTTRQTASQMFTILAGQVADPAVQRLLIQEGLKLLDLRESDRIVEQMDVVAEMEQQMAQMQQQAEQAQAQMDTMTQNMAQQKIALEVEKAKGNIKAEQAVASNEINNQLTNITEASNV